MIVRMALTPGGGRSPSTSPPPAPRPTRNNRTNGTRSPQRPTSPGQRPGARPRLGPALISVLRWGVLIGGLVIIVDLSSQALSQPISGSPDDRSTLAFADHVLNYVLFSIVGILVVRDTRALYLCALAGLLAALLDGVVVTAAAMMTPSADKPLTMELLVAYFAENLGSGTAFAAVSGYIYVFMQRFSGGRRLR
jgi:hypothetical protein